MFYISLILAYIFLPPILLAYSLKLVFQDKNPVGWHLQYLFKYLITLSFLFVLFVPGIDLGFVPANTYSLLALVITYILSFLGIRLAVLKKTLQFYIGGIFAAFMEEILFRGVIFGLSMLVWNSIPVSITVSSVAFGGWHLKNYWWKKDRKWVAKQFLYTTLVYGPIFSIARVYTGDLYLAILIHYLVDSTVALSPDFLRGKVVFDGGMQKDRDSLI